MKKTRTSLVNASNWHYRAINYLSKHTVYSMDVITHFVNLYWNTENSDEENLQGFEVFTHGLDQVFAY